MKRREILEGALMISLKEYQGDFGKKIENELKYFNGIQYLCRGIVRFYILLNKNNSLGVDNDDSEKIRFNKRFRMFRNVQIPQF